MHHKLVLGTMNIGYPYSSNSDTNLTTYTDMINVYLNKTSKQDAILDTAYYYGNTRCEQILGEIIPQFTYLPKIATKVNPWLNNDFSLGKYGQLNKAGITNQLETSLQNLKMDNVEVLFLHCPDYETSFEETLETCNDLWRKEKFNHLGMSNFSVDQLRQMIHICENKDYTLPKFYQGMYNLISRKVEEVMPILTIYSMEFWAYNPLAGGLLTGKYYKQQKTMLKEDSRFKNNIIYQNIFWKPQIMDCLNNNYFHSGREKCLEHSLQWLQYHSKLKENDKIIIGASNKAQLEQNICLLEKPIYYSGKTIKKFDKLYNSIEEFTPNYYY